MPPKRRTSGNTGGGAVKKIKAGHDVPTVPADALVLPHMALFDTWANLGKHGDPRKKQCVSCVPLARLMPEGTIT